MPSSPKIPKDMILEYALKMLVRDGYDAINIKAIANEIGCSTQPISWHFGNMDGLRSALSEYAQNYANNKLLNIQENAVHSFLDIGLNYLDIAFDEPNLFIYLYMNGGSGCVAGDVSFFSNVGQNAILTEQLAKQLGISNELARAFVQNLTIYTHGLASYIATDVVNISKENAKQMLKRVGKSFFKMENLSLQ